MNTADDGVRVSEVLLTPMRPMASGCDVNLTVKFPLELFFSSLNSLTAAERVLSQFQRTAQRSSGLLPSQLHLNQGQL